MPPPRTPGPRWDLRGGRGEGSLRGVVHHQGLEKCQAKDQQPAASSHLPDRRSIPLPQVGKTAVIINSIIVCGGAGGVRGSLKPPPLPPPAPSQEAQPRDARKSGSAAEGGEEEEEKRWRSVGGVGEEAKQRKERE